MTIPAKDLTEIVAHLATKPGHEKVRTYVHDLLSRGLGAPATDIKLELNVIEARGRIDALLGRTVIEVKSDLARERDDAEVQLARYLPEREKATGQRFVGIATDGAEFVAYEMKGDKLTELRRFRTDKTQPATLLIWLDSVVAVGSELPPDALNFTHELGRESIAYARSLGEMQALWAKVRTHPEVMLKRQLWTSFLKIVYGKEIEDDGLWFQHTFLVVVAKAIAHRALGLELPDPAALLSGQEFRNSRILGAVESDFFDWLLVAPEGADLVRRLALHVRRFRLDKVRTDVLKILYESLIDPQQRHDLGEYYTPDWLADMACERAIERPLDQTVLDPACGSGSFVFHAVRRHIAAARAAKVPKGKVAGRVAGYVRGMDIHPVATIIARVTYILALGDTLQDRDDEVMIPIYLGDAMQWSVVPMMGGREIEILVPGERERERDDAPVSLRFPSDLCERPAVFDTAIELLIAQSEAQAKTAAVQASLGNIEGITSHDIAVLADAYRILRRLHDAKRNHIWGYVARNLSRPLALSSPGGKVDVVVGNPPWLSLRYMEKDLQKKVRGEMKGLDIWVGGRFATHQDLSALFFVKCADLYLKMGGVIAFVMPHAALTRGQFAKFRNGIWHGPRVNFIESWTFDEHVSPLFPVPSCVLFAERARSATAIPDMARRFSGTLPYRNVDRVTAEKHLKSVVSDVPEEVTLEGTSPYRKAFRQGATLVPRMICMVERVETGQLGGSAATPRIRSRRSTQEKEPWKRLKALEGVIEKKFLRPVYLGENIVPYRAVEAALGVIPFDKGPLDAAKAAAQGFQHLAGWMRRAETLWNDNSAQSISLIERLDFYGNMSAQFPIPATRVVYAASGTIPAAALVRDTNAVIEHKLYWMEVESEQEGRYLEAIINSEAASQRVAHLQSKGQWGARDFDKVLFTMNIERFSAANSLHAEISETALEAERIAGDVALPASTNFIVARRKIRAALTAAGVSGRIDKLVGRLLDEKTV